MRPTGLLLLASTVSAAVYCPPPGPVLPPPTKANPPEQLIAASVFEGLPFNNDTSYTIKANLGGTDVFTYGWIAPQQFLPDENVKPENIKTRMASVTKLYTVFALLLSKVPFEARIREFVPELKGDVWDDVTIGSLASHTSGLGKFGYVGDLGAVPTFNPELLGIPPVNETAPTCDLFPGGSVCSREEVIAMFNALPELPRSPNSGPLYSNTAFNLLGMALEKVHGGKYEDIMKALIFDPLGLKDTSFETPNNTDNAFLPGPGERWLVGEYGNFNPAGGLWSTAKDTITLMRAILDHKLLSAADTRKWLEPRALTSSIRQLVGAPWELYRPDNLDTTFKRPFDIYTKSGGVDGYGAFAVILPEYDLAFSITVAGNSSEVAAKTLLETVSEKLIPWADQLARGEAKLHYAGTYSGSNSTVSVTQDDGPGLVLSDWIMNGVDVLRSVSAMLGLGAVSARAYPTDPDSLGTDRQFWRIHLSGPLSVSDFADFGCTTWGELDRYRYIQQQLDGVYFLMDGLDARRVEFPGWRMVLGRNNE